jgi:hypothetical protein
LRACFIDLVCGRYIQPYFPIACGGKFAALDKSCVSKSDFLDGDSSMAFRVFSINLGNDKKGKNFWEIDGFVIR